MNHQVNRVGHLHDAHRSTSQLQAVESLELTHVTAAVAHAVATVRLDPRHLDAHRIVAFDPADPRSKPVDAVRHRVLQVMAERTWRAVGVLPVTAGCGATVAAINLGLSMARDPGREVLVVDGHVARPCVDAYLGLSRCGEAEGQALVRCEVGALRSFTVLRQLDSFGGMPASTADGTAACLARVRARFRTSTILVDLPPLLGSDEVLPLLAEIDGAVIVAQAGVTTADQIEQALGMISSDRVAQMLLNRARGR